ncbi:hypothetical protein TWF173_006922 [Orbilia oligospora]|uniref:Major facilitator superfamily (MFS) profile domain-containing protein n=2 Tax=Orbilia oligospora TaxID=2813651 RepID=G1XPJ0_ARTOA|nr:hypothetical protein AOL_s00173g358 [Orbilia oligospora ATCC 24927]EGX45257.1 hypothetical protein AOL_s00173g358 [Orbilia oligospora ATCC 24927]KAF3286979.1 hypothetical protein TWF970_008810 [Orbilia oligospora]KAF3312700.1 hypothetical protein TWF173_006922 [Orbilia oligospora]
MASLTDTKQHAEDVEYAGSGSAPSVEIDPEEEKRLVRKIDMIILPTMWLMYLLSYMDRTNIGNAKIAGMEEDLQLTSGQYSIALVVFFIGYVLCEVPSNMILSKVNPSAYIPCMMFVWGIVTICMGFIKTYHHLVGLRVIVGVLESSFAPGIMMLLSSWYKKSEQSTRFSVYISAAILSGAFGGLLAGAITSGLEGAHGIRGWRWLFIVEGVATSGWAAVAYFILPNFPATSQNKFTAREIEVAIARLATENVTARKAGEKGVGHIEALKTAFKSWELWILTLGYMTIVGSSTLSYFYPTLVKGLGYTAHMAQYMTIPIYAVAFVVNLANGFFADKYNRYRGIIIAGWMTVALVTSAIVVGVYGFTARYVLLVLMAAGLWTANGCGLSYGGSTFGSMEPETRAVALAFMNGMGNLASIYGAYLFPSEDAPKYLTGFGVTTAMCFVGIVAYASAHFLMARKERRLASSS